MMESKKTRSFFNTLRPYGNEKYQNSHSLMSYQQLYRTPQGKSVKENDELLFFKANSSKNFNDDEPLEECKCSLITTNPSCDKVKTPADIDDELFSITLNTQYEILQINSVSTVIQPFIFSINSEDSKRGTRVPLDLVCVMDTSELMKGEKTTLLKESLKFLIDILGENDRISIVKCDIKGLRILPLKSVSKKNKREIISAIESLDSDGGSIDIAEGIKLAVKIINDRKYKNPICSIFLLSAGQDSDGLIKLRNLLKTQALRDCPTIYSFGCGLHHDSKLMTAVAKINGGNYYSVEEPETLNECFADAIGGLKSVIAQEVNISIQTLSSEIFPFLEIKKAFGGADVWKTDGRTYTTRINHLPRGKSKSYVLELAIPRTKVKITDDQREIILVEASVTAEISGSKTLWEKQCRLKMTLFNEKEVLPIQIADKEVITNYYRVRAAEIFIEARKAVEFEDKDYVRTRRILENFKVELMRSGVKSEPLILGLLADIQTAIMEMQPILYLSYGRNRLVQQIASHMEEKSNPFCSNSAILYSTRGQREMMKLARLDKC